MARLAAMLQRSLYGREIANLNPDNATAIHVQGSKLVVMSGWEGWHTVSPLSLTVTLFNVSSCMQKRLLVIFSECVTLPCDAS